jgi:Fe2+ or Zn2+ uptake regulation protein
MEKRQRRSPQRDLILSVLESKGSHLTVDDIFKAARKKLPKISLATVYRNLGMLEEQKMIMSMLGPENITYYESYKDPHHHFICNECKEITNMDTPGVQMCVKCIESEGGPKVDKVFTTIYGVCTKCK